MTITDFPSQPEAEELARKPRLAIMGEFSAGKSTLSNLLIGSQPLPVKVTATQLPPVWISYGDQVPYREDLNGDVHEVDLNNLDAVSLADTALIRIFLKSEILELCDLIDMPGISDPNMDAAVWERVLPIADGVIWCSHATQAWRQSEAAVWKSVPEKLYANSFLLLTRYDKLLNQSDRERVVKRVMRETKGMFAGIYPISLTNAIAAQDDRGQWELSGAEEFAQDLIDLVQDLSLRLEPPVPMQPVVQAQPTPEPAENVLRLDEAKPSNPQPVNPGRIMPSRVQVGVSAARTRRPARDEVPAHLNDAVAQAGQAGLGKNQQ